MILAQLDQLVTFRCRLSGLGLFGGGAEFLEFLAVLTELRHFGGLFPAARVLHAQPDEQGRHTQPRQNRFHAGMVCEARVKRQL